MVTMDETVVLVTAVARKQPKPGQSFFPLTVNYQEKTYATGRIPGGFFKREGRPSEKETLTSRLIDRPIRPLFPKGFMNEVQVICTVMSSNRMIDPDIPALIGASAALGLSGVPFAGPLGAARVGYVEGAYVLNPGYAELKESDLDMVVAGTRDAVLMVESEAKELSEDEMLGAVLFAHQEMQVVVDAVSELVAEAGKPAWDWTPETENTALIDAVTQQVGAGIGEAYRITEKTARSEQLSVLKASAVEALCVEGSDVSAGDVSDAFAGLEKNIVRTRVLDGEPRIDGRDLSTVRGLGIEIGILSRVHGS